MTTATSNNAAHAIVGDGLLTVRQAAQFLGLSIASLYAFMGRGDLPFVKFGRSRRIPKKAVVELAAKNLVAPPQVD